MFERHKICGYFTKLYVVINFARILSLPPIGTNILSIIPGMILSSVGGSILKIVPGLGTAGGMAITGTTFYALSTVMGWTYLKAIMFLVSSDVPINEKNLKVATKQVTKDKDFIKEIYNSAKSDFQE